MSQLEGRINNQILGVKGLNYYYEGSWIIAQYAMVSFFIYELASYQFCLWFLKLTLELSFQFSWNTQRICEGFVGEKKKLARLFKRYAELTNSHLGVTKVIQSKSVIPEEEYFPKWILSRKLDFKNMRRKCSLLKIQTLCQHV